MACRSPKAMGFDMAVVPYFRWEQLQDDDAKRKFLWETLPAQVLIISWALWGGSRLPPRHDRFCLVL